MTYFCNICEDLILPGENYKVKNGGAVHIECLRKQSFQRLANTLSEG